MILFQNDNVTVFQSVLFQTNSTVVATDDCIIIVDPTWLPHEINEIKEYVESIKNNRPIYLYFTHGDFDHIIGYNAFPNAQTIGSENLHNHPEKEIKVSKIRQFYNDNYINHVEPIEFPRVDLIISEEGQEIKIGQTTLRFYNAPGHTQDGLFLYIENLGIWITGDYLSDFELPIVFDSVKSYYNTLDKAEELISTFELTLLIPGHGQVSSNKKEINRRIELGRNYLKRLQNAVQEMNEAEIDSLEKEFLFPSGFTKYCHESNVNNMKKEFGLV
ncbi:MBL fold metallo-hydrolase [Arthrobacter citreus]|nr:MBL fold metallo-hydrolase [Arthrobacter citreus]